MKASVTSKKMAIVVGLLIGGFSFYWYFDPFPWLGATMGVLFGSFAFFALSTRRIERLRRTIFISFFILAMAALLAIILDMGFSNYMAWVDLYQPEYYLPGQAVGVSNLPAIRLAPQTILGAATYQPGLGWEARMPSSFGELLITLAPYLLTVLVFGRAFCGWVCPYGGLPEASVTGRKERWKMRMFTTQVTTESGFRYAGLKQWVIDSKYGLLLAVILLSIFFAFPLVSVFVPALWLKHMIFLERDIFWLIIAILVTFSIFLPFMTKRRWWCIICPAGAVTSLFNKISLFRIKIDQKKCVKCMDCVQECRMYAMTPEHVEHGECTSINCVRCGRCIEVCSEDAVDLYWLGNSKKMRPWLISLAIFTVSVWGLWFIVALTDILFV